MGSAWVANEPCSRIRRRSRRIRCARLRLPCCCWATWARFKRLWPLVAVGAGDAVSALERPIQPWDIQSIIYTSGTTGPSKGVLSSYLHMFSNAGPESWPMVGEDDPVRRIELGKPLGDGPMIVEEGKGHATSVASNGATSASRRLLMATYSGLPPNT